MAIKLVRAQVNGTWYTLTYDSASDKYIATITAPGATSYNLNGGYYNVTVEATNIAGTVATVDASDFTSLELYVKEKVAPVITILSPTSGAYVTNSKQPVIFTVIDETGGSGVNSNSITVTIDGVLAASSTISKTAISGGYSVTYTPASALSEGSHTITINASDNDGNAATAASTTYTIDTVPPTLNISSPTDGLITNDTTITVKGTTNDATATPTTVTVTVNGTETTATVDSAGIFSKTIALAEGSNTIVITTVDAAGQETTVIRTVTLDTTIPTVVSASVIPNPVDTGKTVVITVEIEERAAT